LKDEAFYQESKEGTVTPDSLADLTLRHIGCAENFWLLYIFKYREGMNFGFML
jgi:hypothetical protein